MITAWSRPDVVNAIIAGTALVLSVLGLVLQHRLQQRTDARDAARRDDELRAQRSAKVVAYFEVRPSARDVFIRNDGSSVARNIKVQLTEATQGKRDNEVIEWPSLGSGASAKLRYITISGLGPRPEFHVAVGWDDDSGVPGLWESTIPT